jgi:two-component system sensor histidine kinase AgrC
MYNLANTTQLALTTTDLEQEKENNRILKEMQDELHGFRHDFSNIMCTIGGYVQVRDIDGLSKYYSQIQKDVTKLNNLGTLNSEVINNPAIFILISSKYSKALELGINMNINVFLDLNNLNMKIYEFTRILGILLDNAIEAAKDCDEKIINIEIRKDSKRNRQLLIIENTYKNKDIDTEKIFEKKYSTKEGNSGLGLWEVRQILKKSTNLNLFTTKDNTFFKQQLEMYNI